MPAAVPQLHRLAKQGNFSGVQMLLRSSPGAAMEQINALDSKGYTPLMYAVASGSGAKELVRTLLDHGARLDAVHQQEQRVETVLALAIGAGDPEVVRLLLDRGADIHYRRQHNYDALIDACYGRDLMCDRRLMELLALLVERGAALNSVTSYQESALRVLSHVGRFDAVNLLLEAGADESQLEWSPLIRSVALGSLQDVKDAVASGAQLEAKDRWERTAWLVAVQIGDIAKAQYLLESGADPKARSRSGWPSLFHALQSRQMTMLNWLLAEGADVEEVDDFGYTPLMMAAANEQTFVLDLRTMSWRRE